jgi:hypothetical protein
MEAEKAVPLVKANWLIITGIAVVISFLLYHQVFTADYAFTDEAHQLWNNQDNSNFVMFLNQGRILTGWFIHGSFFQMDELSDIRYLRIFSFFTLIVFVAVFSFLSEKLFHSLQLSKHVWVLSVMFVPCSLSAAVYIGWASCAEIFLSALAGFLSGYFLFVKLNKEEKYLTISNFTLVVSLLLAIVSLLTYQLGFGLFLYPFFLYFIKKKDGKINRVLLAGIVFYIICYVVYYFLFKYLISVYNIPASTRTAVKIDPLGKLSFLLSFPLAQAFSFNFLYNARSILSQSFYIFVLLFWIATCFLQRKGKPIGSVIMYVALFFFLFALIYFPLMISMENFASYRTMFALNLAVFVLLSDAVSGLIQKEKFRQFFVVSFCSVFISTAFYNYNDNLVKPLRKEYATVRHFFNEAYNNNDTVVFRRPRVNLFQSAFSINCYTDEFGYPSTEKNWTVEPLIKQLVYEKTGNRKTANRLTVLNFAFEDSAAFRKYKPSVNRLIIDMETVFFK